MVAIIRLLLCLTATCWASQPQKIKAECLKTFQCSEGSSVSLLLINDHKKIVCKRTSNDNGWQRFSAEANALKALQNSRHVVKMLNHSSELEYSDLFLEYLAGGDVFQFYMWIPPAGAMPERLVAAIVLQIIPAIADVHKHRIIHRDIKLENFFIAENGAIKIGDFGLSTFVEVEEDSAWRYLCIGTSCRRAPEMIAPKSYYDQKVDIWSLGATLLHLVGIAPQVDASEIAPHCTGYTIVEKISGDNPSAVEHLQTYSVDFQQLVFDCLQLDPKKRPSAEKLMAHPFIASWSKVLSPKTVIVEALNESHLNAEQWAELAQNTEHSLLDIQTSLDRKKSDSQMDWIQQKLQTGCSDVKHLVMSTFCANLVADELFVYDSANDTTGSTKDRLKAHWIVAHKIRKHLHAVSSIVDASAKISPPESVAKARRFVQAPRKSDESKVVAELQNVSQPSASPHTNDHQRLADFVSRLSNLPALEAIPLIFAELSKPAIPGVFQLLKKIIEQDCRFKAKVNLQRVFNIAGLVHLTRMLPAILAANSILEDQEESKRLMGQIEDQFKQFCPPKKSSGLASLVLCCKCPNKVQKKIDLVCGHLEPVLSGVIEHIKSEANDHASYAELAFVAKTQSRLAKKALLKDK